MLQKINILKGSVLMSKIFRRIAVLMITLCTFFTFTGCSNLANILNAGKQGIADIVNPIKLDAAGYCENCSIKFLDDRSSAVVYTITPGGFDMQELNLRGYQMNVTVTYEVYYRKDYDVLWDIGYAGSPRYEIYLVNDAGLGAKKENLSTTTSATKRSISENFRIVDLQNTRLTLTFSTDNIQNIIYFKNIIVEYHCFK